LQDRWIPRTSRGTLEKAKSLYLMAVGVSQGQN
jgi:hypothetical protein